MKIAIIDDMESDSMIIAKYLRRYFQEAACLEPVVYEIWSGDSKSNH